MQTQFVSAITLHNKTYLESVYIYIWTQHMFLYVSEKQFPSNSEVQKHNISHRETFAFLFLVS